MTIKQIAMKYNVPYNIVYLATYGVNADPFEGREKDYDEAKVIGNLKCILQERTDRYERKAKEHREMLERVKAE